MKINHNVSKMNYLFLYNKKQFIYHYNKAYTKNQHLNIRIMKYAYYM